MCCRNGDDVTNHVWFVPVWFALPCGSPQCSCGFYNVSCIHLLLKVGKAFLMDQVKITVLHLTSSRVAPTYVC